MAETSEEKVLPASDKKLKDARKKGQVARAGDLVSGAVIVGFVLFVINVWPGAAERLMALVDVVVRQSQAPTARDLSIAVVLAGEVWAAVILPALIVGVGLVLVSGVAATGGPVFAMEVVAPKPEKISPASGFKRIFGKRAWAELGKSLAKVIVLSAAFISVVRHWLQPLMEIPACGLTCLGPLLVAMLKTVASIAAGLFLAVGLVDILLQKRLFLGEMRMTKTEAKQEHKNQEGDPHMQAERRRIRQEIGNSPRLGLGSAVIIVAHQQHVIGLHYISGEGLPFVVFKAKPEQVASVLAEAHRRGLPVEVDPEVAAELATHALGDGIREKLYTPVAMILVRHGLI